MLSQHTALYSPYVLTILRVATGFMFWQHGIRKFGFLGGEPREFLELRWFAAVLETFGGPLISLGIFTRPLSFLLSGEMASAYFISHNPRGFWPIINSGEASYTFCFLFLYLVTVGPGRFSLDGWIARRFGPRWWM